jgi:hypothetical protein
MGDAEYVPRPELEDAAGVLLVIGCGDPFRLSSEVRLSCLWAAERLREVGARPSRALEPGKVGDVLEQLASVVTALNRLSAGVPQRAAIAEVIAALGELLAADC